MLDRAVTLGDLLIYWERKLLVAQEALEALRQLHALLDEEVGKGKRLQKNPNAIALGKLGGSAGGKARAAKLTAERRREIASNAALKRWKKRPSQD